MVSAPNLSADQPTTMIGLPQSRRGYGRARLWLGISAVGATVLGAVFVLVVATPAGWLQPRTDSLPSHLAIIAIALFIHALIQTPFDALGGYLLPRRFGRTHRAWPDFVVGLARGVVVQVALFLSMALVIMIAARLFGVLGAIVACLLGSLGLLQVREPLACLMGSLVAGRRRLPGLSLNGRRYAVASVLSDDEGFTGGWTGVFSPRRLLVPERMVSVIGAPMVDALLARRQSAIESGSWRRGRWLAIGFTWSGITAAAIVVGGPALEGADGIVQFSAIFTLWSFAGLLVLPTLSRRGVAEVDVLARRVVDDPAVIDRLIEQLDVMQDDEPQRPALVETIFHPVPSVTNRAGKANGSRVGFLDAARTAIFLSPSGLGLLGRAVHCNCGRPALWAFLPSD